MTLDDDVLALYRESRAAYLRGDIAEATEAYKLNRYRHGVELFYELALPAHVKFVHPLGSVLSKRATYGDYFVCYHGVSVGVHVDRREPTLGEGVVLFPGSRVIGRCAVGNNVWVQAGTTIYNTDIPDNSIVFTSYDPVRHRMGVECVPTTRSVKERFFP